MSSTFFISDLHLDAARPHVTEALAAFLHNHRQCTALYILGDLFEAWVGDDDDAPLAIAICKRLRQFSDAGPQLYLMQGNRDFMLRQGFATRAGAALLPDPTIIDLYGAPTLLMHGDSLCIGDTAYQAFRQQAREPQWQDDMLQRSLAERRSLAANLRKASNEATSNKAQDIVDVDAQEIERVVKAQGVTQLIHGHTHRPSCHNLPWGQRWVLGDWDKKAWIIEASEEQIKLYNFDI